MSADMFHITRSRDVDDIFRDGLRRSSRSPAEKQADEIVAEEGGTDAMEHRREGPTEQAERWFDELLNDAQRAVEGAGKFPQHDYAVFFWPTRNQAEQSAKSVNWSADIVAVDSSELPSGCKCAIAPTDGIDQIFKIYYDAARGHGSFDRQEQFRRAKEWWRKVEPYEGNNLRRHEIWCGCDVPPAAIEWIYDRSRNKRLYEPPGEGQQRLLDFEEP